MLAAYLIYIKEELDCHSDVLNINELKKHAVVLTNQGPRNPATHPVHFSTQYDNNIDLPRVLPGYQWVIVDALYLHGSTGNVDRHGWRDFLSKLGVIDFLWLQTTESVLSKDALVSPIDWSTI